MANPQIENGFTRIANEIIEALMRINVSAYQTRVLLAIWRKTYGWKKKEDWISNSQLVEMTGIRKQHVSRTIKDLRDRNIVTKSGYKIAFNKDHTQWRELPRQATVTPSGNNVTNSGNGVTSSGVHKRNYTKENTCSNRELSELLASLILKNNPSHCRLSNSKHDQTVTSWAIDIDRMIRIDKRSIEEIERIIRWCQTDNFWKKNILSGRKLRDQFDQLIMKAPEPKKDWRNQPCPTT